jgi:hypothetical protein
MTPRPMPPEATTGGHGHPQTAPEVLVQPSTRRSSYRLWSVHQCSFLASGHLCYINDISHYVVCQGSVTILQGHNPGGRLVPGRRSWGVTEGDVDPARVSCGGMEWAADRGEDQKRLDLAVISAQRKALLDARDDGYFGADALNAALAVLDADQISLELKGAPTDRD